MSPLNGEMLKHLFFFTSVQKNQFLHLPSERYHNDNSNSIIFAPLRSTKTATHCRLISLHLIFKFYFSTKKERLEQARQKKKKNNLKSQFPSKRITQ